MTDREAIIERAARALADRFDGELSQIDRVSAEAVLLAVCPGLLDGTAWLAPNEPTAAMLHAATLEPPTWDDKASRRKYIAMRDANR